MSLTSGSTLGEDKFYVSITFSSSIERAKMAELLKKMDREGRIGGSSVPDIKLHSGGGARSHRERGQGPGRCPRRRPREMHARRRPEHRHCVHAHSHRVVIV